MSRLFIFVTYLRRLLRAAGHVPRVTKLNMYSKYMYIGFRIYGPRWDQAIIDHILGMTIYQVHFTNIMPIWDKAKRPYIRKRPYIQ